MERPLGRQWDFNLAVATGRGGADDRRDPLDVKANVRPLLIRQDYDGYQPLPQILLITYVLVRAYKDIEASLFGSADDSPFPISCQPNSAARVTSWPGRLLAIDRGVP